MRRGLKWTDLELLDQLGTGHAGVVRRAKLRRPFLEFAEGELVAIKQYKMWVLEEPGQLERILREVETGRKVNHPHLVRTISIIFDDQNRPALVMKHYEGETLEQKLDGLRARNEQIELAFVLQAIEALAGAIGTLHQAGVVHRDVKPSNIMITPDGPILMDLGVISSRDFPEQTTTDSFLGTIRYADPLYLMGDPYEPKNDVYSLGAVISELISGKVFFGKYTNWARLIVERSEADYLPHFLAFADVYGPFTTIAAPPTSFHGPLPPEIAPVYIEEQFGMKLAEFFLSILQHSLTERDLVLESLKSAIKRRVWEQPFRIERGKFVKSPPKFPSLRQFARNRHDKKFTLDQIVTQIRKVLSPSDVSFLRYKMRQLIWVKVWPMVHDARTWDWKLTKEEKVKLPLLLSAGIAAEFNTSEIDFHPALRYAYIYGKL